MRLIILFLLLTTGVFAQTQDIVKNTVDYRIINSSFQLTYKNLLTVKYDSTTLCMTTSKYNTVTCYEIFWKREHLIYASNKNTLIIYSTKLKELYTISRYKNIYLVTGHGKKLKRVKLKVEKLHQLITEYGIHQIYVQE